MLYCVGIIFWRAFSSGRHYLLAGIFLWQALSSGRHFPLAGIIFWQAFSSGRHYLLAGIFFRQALSSGRHFLPAGIIFCVYFNHLCRLRDDTRYQPNNTLASPSRAPRSSVTCVHSRVVHSSGVGFLIVHATRSPCIDSNASLELHVYLGSLMLLDYGQLKTEHNLMPFICYVACEP